RSRRWISSRSCKAARPRRRALRRNSARRCTRSGSRSSPATPSRLRCTTKCTTRCSTCSRRPRSRRKCGSGPGASGRSTRAIEIATLDFEPFLQGGAAEKARFAEEFGKALHEIGFAVLTGHAVEASLYDQMHDEVLDLFTSTSLEEKMRFRARRFGSVNQGYFPIEETSEIHPDLVEGWVWCRRAFDIHQERDRPFRAEDYWPKADDEARFRRLVHAHEPLIKPIAQAMF